MNIIKNKIKKYLPSSGLAAGIVDSPIFQGVGQEFGTGLTGPAGETTLGGLITSIVSILLVVAGAIAVVFLIIGGYQYVTSRGNEEASEAAKKTISSAIVGLVVIIMSFVVIRIVASILITGNTGV